MSTRQCCKDLKTSVTNLSASMYVACYSSISVISLITDGMTRFNTALILIRVSKCHICCIQFTWIGS